MFLAVKSSGQAPAKHGPLAGDDLFDRGRRNGSERLRFRWCASTAFGLEKEHALFRLRDFQLFLQGADAS